MNRRQRDASSHFFWAGWCLATGLFALLTEDYVFAALMLGAGGYILANAVCLREGYLTLGKRLIRRIAGWVGVLE